jgi:hypothetical protein
MIKESKQKQWWSAVEPEFCAEQLPWFLGFALVINFIV